MASVQGVYIAIFGRPADPVGLEYWNGVTDNGADLSQMIAAFTDSDEYRERFAGQSNDQIISSIYQSLFGREPDAEGLAFYSEALENGILAIESIAVSILDGAQEADEQSVNNKEDAANRFTESLDTPDEIEGYSGEVPAREAAEFLSTVNEDPESVPSGEEVDKAIEAVNGGDYDPDGEPEEPPTGGDGGGDTTPPSATLTLDAIADDGVVNAGEAAGTVAITGTVSGEFQEGDKVSIAVNGVMTTGSVAADGTFSVGVDGDDLAGDGDTTVEVSVLVSDAAGNTATVTDTETYTIDVTADVDGDLAVAITEDALNSSELAAVAYTVSGLDADADDVVTFTGVDGNGDALTATGVDGTADLTGFVDGTVTASISATDAAGNTADGAEDTVLLDVTADVGGDLSVAIAADALNGSQLAAVAYTVSGLDADAEERVIFTGVDADGNSLGAIGLDGTVDLTNFADGTVTASVSATDAAGNTADGAEGTVELDSTPPSATLTLDAIADDGVVNASEAAGTVAVTGTVSGEFQEGDALSVTVNDVATTGSLGADGKFSVNVAGSDLVADTTVDATVLVSDAAGNTATATDTETYTIDTMAPTLDGSSPSDDGMVVGAEANIVLNFNEQVQAGTGSIVIMNLINSSIHETIDVSSAQVIFESSGAVTINPSVNFILDFDYGVLYDDGVIEDLAGNDSVGLAAGDLEFYVF